jgi:hypothetical protein
VKVPNNRLAGEDVPVRITDPIVRIQVRKTSIRTIPEITEAKEQRRYLEALCVCYIVFFAIAYPAYLLELLHTT